jgi:hypothetical protein
MGYTDETRHVLRAHYIYERMPLQTAADMAGVSYSCARTWKRKAAKAGDDWDKQRLLHSVSAEGVLGVARKTLEEYLIQHQATVEALRLDPEVSALDRATILCRLADSYDKVIRATKGMAPEVSKLSVAMEILKMLGNYIKKEYPQHADKLVEVLEPFGRLVTKSYG